MFQGAAAAGKAFQVSAPRRVGPCRPALEATHSTERTHVCFGLVCGRLSRLRTAVCLKPATCSHSGATTWRSGWHGKGEEAGQQMHCVAWIQIVLPRPVRKTDRSCRDSCCKRLSSRTARTKETSTTGHACRGIFCADQNGSIHEEFRRQNA